MTGDPTNYSRDAIQADDAGPGRASRCSRPGLILLPAHLPAVESLRDRRARAVRGGPARLLAGGGLHGPGPRHQGPRHLPAIRTGCRHPPSWAVLSGLRRAGLGASCAAPSRP